jgi:hypothetical protein
MLCVTLGVTPIGKFAKYNLELYSSMNVESIIEDSQWQALLERFQFFLGIVLMPAVSFLIAICCTFAQKNRRLLVTYLASLPIPAFLELSASYSHLRFVFRIGLNPGDLVPIGSLLVNVSIIYLAYKIVQEIWGSNEKGAMP